jgi:hypothetical protein
MKFLELRFSECYGPRFNIFSSGNDIRCMDLSIGSTNVVVVDSVCTTKALAFGLLAGWLSYSCNSQD